MFFGFTAKASATTYYVRTDGTVTAANKANATSPNAVGTSLNMAQVKLATFLASDQVLFSSQGGNYTEVLNLPSGGSGVDAEITYANVPTETPTISAAVGNLIDTNSKTYVKVIGFSLAYTGSSDVYGVRIRGSNITLQYISVDMGGHGYNIVSQDTISNVLIDNIILTNGKTTLDALYLFGASSSNITVQNSTTGSGTRGIDIRNASNVTVTNISSTAGVRFFSVTTGTISSVSAVSSFNGATDVGLVLKDSSGITVNDFSYSGNDYPLNIYGTTNNITINRLTVGGGALSATIKDTANNIIVNDSTINNGYGFVVLGDAHDITYNRCSVINSTSGFRAQDNSYNIIYNNCTADNNTNLGFFSTDQAYNITYWYCEASYNGTINITSDGGGLLPHVSSTNVKAYYSIAHHNYNEGIGDVSSGTNTNYNIVNWANGYAMGETFKGSTVTSPTTGRGNMYFGMTGGNGLFKNIISGGGKPRERSDYVPLSTTFDYNLYNPLDNNLFTTNNGGVTNIPWSTYHATNETHSQNADPLFTNATGNYTAVTDFQLSYLSPAIDTGTSWSGITATTTDYAGNPIYGTPDIGAYEYQPPFVLGTSLVDPTGNIRIYGDRKYRYTTATSSTMSANFSVAPAEGSWSYTASTTRPEWLNISSITWGATKQWTASSTTATTTVYTVGNLLPGTAYTFKLDGVASPTTITDSSQCVSGVCISNGSGVVTFTYTGGYSTHTFALMDITAPILTETTPIATPSTDTTPSYVFSSTEAGTLLYTGSCTPGSTNISLGTNTITFNTLLDGTYANCKLSVIDSAGNNSATTTLASFIVDTTAPATSVSISGATYSNNQSASLSCFDAGSGCDKIYYTTDGSTPTVSSQTYSTPIVMNSGSTALRFFAIDLLGNNETVKIENYMIITGAIINTGGGGGGGSVSSTPTPTPTATTTPATITIATTTSPIITAAPISYVQQWQNILVDATTISSGNLKTILSAVGEVRNIETEASTAVKYTANLTSGLNALSDQAKNAITNFITYGTPTTVKLGIGERAGTINSFKTAFGKAPTVETEWRDCIAIGNGRWPNEKNAETETNAEVAFKKIYLRNADRNNPNDDAAVTIISYGLRPTQRNLDSERAAIKSFMAIYGYIPKSASAWDIVRAIAYSGSKR